MREQAYWLFALVSWPALGWGACELGLRALTHNATGMFDTLAIMACAAGCICASRLRVRQLSPAPPRD